MLDRLAPPAAGPMAALDTSVSSNSGEYLGAIGKASPALAVSAAGIAGMPLETWVIVLTLVYLGLQIAYLVWKWARDLRRDRAEGEDRADG